MSGYLTKIKTKIPFSNKTVDIDVKGKTLILTGGNGCGKTQLLNCVYGKLKDRVIKRNNETREYLQQQIGGLQKAIKRDGPATSSYDSWVRQLEETNKQLNELDNPPINLSNIEDFVLKYKELQSVLLQFEAGRKSDILKPSSVAPMDSLKEKDRNSYQKITASSMFEEFLITSIANQAFSESKKINDNPEEAQRIDKWFNKLVQLSVYTHTAKNVL